MQTCLQTASRQAVAATILAGVVGYFAIIWLTQIVRSGRIWYFSIYLIVLGIVVLMLAAFGSELFQLGGQPLILRFASRLTERCGLPRA